MSLLEGSGFAHDYLPADVPDEAVLVDDEIDVEGVDTGNVVFVGDDDVVMPENMYRLWTEGTVAVVPINNDDQIELQSCLNDSENIYDHQQYEYMQTEELPVEGSQIEEDFQLECSLPSRYIDANELEYTEEDVVPIEHAEAVEFQVEEVEEVTNRGRRKPATVVQCEVCGVVVKHPSKIEAHMRTHTGEKPFECEICGAKFTQRTPMLNHVRRHLGQTPYACGYGCGKSFVNNAQKKAHELRHLGTKRSGPPRPHLKPPKRQIWNKTAEVCSSQGGEERSTMVDFAPPVGQIERPISATASKRLDEVIESVVSGIPIKKKKKSRTMRAPLIVQCQVCGLMLKHASKIKAHIRTHTGDRPYLCAHCFASFSTSGTLDMHIKRKHMTGERPYSCTWDCGRRFVSISTRNEHERVVHAGAKRYECTVAGCHRMFTRRCYLMLHRQREHALIFKPIFDPQEIERAEKEADMELTAEKQQGIAKDSSCVDPLILVDPATNMLVHVSKDGMVLEPIDEQPTFVGEFVEENEEPEISELFDEEVPEANTPKLYIPAQPPRSAEIMPPDVGLDAGASIESSTFPSKKELMDEEMTSNDNARTEDYNVSVTNEDKSRKSGESFALKRVVNILKRTLPVRLPPTTYKQ